jgi:ATP/maltotriose-dependent transcriptional regulator MalT
VLAQQGEVEASLQQLDDAAALAAEVDSNLFVSLHKAWKAESLIRSGRTDEALPIAVEAIALARETRQQGCEAEAHRVHGWALWYANGDADGALTELRTSLSGHERTGGRILIVRVLYELGELLRATGDEAGAVEAEARASSLAAECGATWLPIPAARPPAG